MKLGINFIDLVIPSVFLLSLSVALILYWIGGRISAKGEVTPGELSPYACGEDLPAEKLRLNEQRFFIFWVYFLIFDILAFILATSLGHPSIMPALYAGITLLAIAMLSPLRRIK